MTDRRTNLTGSATEKALSLEKLVAMMESAGVRRLYFKRLAANDNSKNQIYLGGDLATANMIPTGKLSLSHTRSGKSGAEGKRKIQAAVNFAWLDAAGRIVPAPDAKLILYPQYSEVRFSGFLRGCSSAPAEFMDTKRRGRAPGRILFFGVVPGGRVIGYLASPDSAVSAALSDARVRVATSVLQELEMPGMAEGVAAKEVLLGELARIHGKGWIRGWRLGADGQRSGCDSRNCGGYTLEAELGITPNGYAEPDYRGWEIKQYTVRSFASIASKAITLMTPEPSGGYYTENGVEAFVRRYGYADQRGREDRLNFGGIYRYGQRNTRTALTLALDGYDAATGRITDPAGQIVLVDREGIAAASWDFAKLLDHWKRKHACAAFVRSLAKNEDGKRYYMYGDQAQLGTGTAFQKLLAAFAAGAVYYDPALKIEGASGPKPLMKRRNQFRIGSSGLKNLYDTFEVAEVGHS